MLRKVTAAMDGGVLHFGQWAGPAPSETGAALSETGVAPSETGAAPSVCFLQLAAPDSGPSTSRRIVPRLPPLIMPARVALALFLFGVGVASAAHGQNPAAAAPESVPDTVVQRVASAFLNADAQALLTPSADRVEVSLFGTRTFYSSAQAFYVLEDFFDTHPPTGFEVDDVTETGESCFLRGQLDHRRDERTLQVYVRLMRRDAAWQLQEIRIDADAE